MNKKRPVNLDIGTIRLPITAWVSITHRVSGVVLLGGILILTWMLDASLRSEDSFAALQTLLLNPLVKLVLWGILSAVAYHLVMGVRHLVMDLGVGETLQGGQLGAKIALAFAVILILAAGGWLLW